MIKIENVEMFCEFLTSVVQIVPDAKFVVDEDKTFAYVLREGQMVRAFFTTNSCVSEKGEHSFCLKEINKFQRAIELINKVGGDEIITLKYDKGFISYNGKGSFRFKTVKEDQIEMFVSKALKTELKPESVFECDYKQFRQFLSSCSVVADKPDQVKIYIYQRKNEIVGEMGDRMNKFSDSISLPISDKIESGTLVNPQTLVFANALTITTLKTDKLKISVVPEYKFVVVDATKKLGESFYIDMKLLVRTSKG
jgi:hypothetical protein